MPVSATPYKERNETSLGIDRHISKEDSEHYYVHPFVFCSAYLILQSTLPLGKIRMQTFGTRILWKRPSFSFRKNVSGIHTFLASVIVRYWILAVIESRFYTVQHSCSSHSSNAYNSLQNPPYYCISLSLPSGFFLLNQLLPKTLRSETF